MYASVVVKDNHSKEFLIQRVVVSDDPLTFIQVKTENVYNRILEFSLACLFLLKFSEFEIYNKGTGISNYNKEAGTPDT